MVMKVWCRLVRPMLGMRAPRSFRKKVAEGCCPVSNLNRRKVLMWFAKGAGQTGRPGTQPKHKFSSGGLWFAKFPMHMFRPLPSTRDWQTRWVPVVPWGRIYCPVLPCARGSHFL